MTAQHEIKIGDFGIARVL